jgi:parallel beta-helix repeat protein
MLPTLLFTGVALALVAAPAAADTINVRPGNNAIQKAVNRADPGDRLLVKQGRYREDVVVDKRLRIVGRRGRPPVIDGECDSPITVDVVANGVTLERLKVKGARFGGGFGYAVNLIRVESGTLRDLVLKESCNASPAYYGVNVFDTGALQITGIDVSGGYVDAGIYVGGIGDVGSEPFRIAHNEAFGNNVGILIEDSIPEANIVVRDNFAHDNDFGDLSTPAGILVRRSDGGRYIDNRANRNGVYGIHLLDDNGNTADDNLIRGNRAFGNGDLNFFDEGTGNCGSGNSFPIDPC